MAGVVLITMALVTAVGGHAVSYRPRQAANSAEVLEVAKYIQKNTDEDSVLVCLSNDWSPLVSYYARRRALNPPLETERPMPADVLTRAFAQLEGEKVGAIITVETQEPVRFSPETAQQLLHDAGFDNVPVLSVTGLPKF